MGASIVRKTAHETGGHRSAVSFIEYATVRCLLFPSQKRQPEQRTFLPAKNKKVEDLGTQEL